MKLYVLFSKGGPEAIAHSPHPISTTDKCQRECCARCSISERESTASGARENKLLGRHWRDLMLEETRLDTTSPSGVKGCLCEEIRGEKERKSAANGYTEKVGYALKLSELLRMYREGFIRDW